MKNSYKLALLGHPVEHSLSPDIHKIFARHAALTISYDKIDATEDSYPAVAARLAAQGYDGYNVTTPGKTVAARLSDKLSEEAAIIGAANTIKIEGGRTGADSTDGAGMYLGILRETGWADLAGRRVLLLGFGGAARSIAAAFALRGVRLTVLCPPGEAKPDYCGGKIAFEDSEAFGRAAISRHIKECEILINATPLGMKGFPQFPDLTFLDDARANTAICDCVYNPIDTSLLTAARRTGLPTVGGLSMLVFQAAEAFRIWTGVYPSDAAIDEVFGMLKTKV